jgi:hypothetical protein
MESVFADIARTESGPKRRSEGIFTYLNRSADEHAARVRALIDRWYADFSTEGKHEVRQRLQLGGTRGFESAFHELLLSATANALGCVVAIHPHLGDTAKRPDFTVESTVHGTSFLEAVLATGQSDFAAAAEQREHTLLDALDDLECPEYFVAVEVIQRSGQPGSGKRLRRFVSEQFDGLNLREVRRGLEKSGMETLPRFSYAEDGWIIELRACPKSPSAMDDPVDRAVGIEMTGMHRIDPATPLRKALKRKASRYGELGEPFIIAVNALDIFANDVSFREALLGTECIQVTHTAEGVHTAEARNPDGLWRNTSGPSYTRVSAVLFTRKARSSNFLLGAEARLYLNPWAERPYSGELTRLPTTRAEGTQYVDIPGVSMEELLGVGKFWRN